MKEKIKSWIIRKETQYLKGSSIGARFIRGIFWLLVSTFFSQGLSMIASVVTARLLGKYGFGELGMIISTIGMFGTFAGLGLGLTATKYIAEWRTKDLVRTGNIIVFSTQLAAISGGAAAIILFVLAPQLAKTTLNAPHLVNELCLGCVLLFLNAFNGLQSGALAGFEAFRTVTKINVVRGLSNFPILIIGTWYFGVPGAVGGFVLVAVIGCWLSHVSIDRVCKKEGIPLNYWAVKSELPILWKFSVPAFLSNIIVGPSFWIANTLLVHQPGGYGELGLLNAANQWRNVLMLLPGIFCNAALPILSGVQETEGEREGKSSFNQMMEIIQSITLVTVIPLSCVIMLIGDYIMALYGHDFSSGMPVLVGIVTGITIAAIGAGAGTGIQAKGLMWFGFVENVLWGLFYIGFVFFFVGKFGALALSLGFMVSYFLLSILVFFYLFYLKVVTKDILIRTISSILFVSLFSILAMLISRYATVRLVLLIPSFVFSIWLGLYVLSPLYVRQRILVYFKRIPLIPVYDKEESNASL